jgi:hypothetical protein
MEVIQIQSHWDSYSYKEVELPEGKTLNDVKSFSQKYNTVFLDFKDGSNCEIEKDEEDYDYEKRPWKIVITNEQGDELIEEN